MQNDGLALLRSKSLKVAPPGKEFTLASGKTSRVYLDVRRTALSPEGHVLLGRELLAAVVQRFPGAQLVAGVALGGCPLASAVSMTSAGTGRPLAAVYVRKEAKAHGSGQFVEGPFEPGQRVVLLEDVVTTGGSSEKAIHALREAGLEVTGVLAVVDREEGGAVRFADMGVPFRSLWTMSQVLEGAL
jgi:orotate phosphoribosyltransferase